MKTKRYHVFMASEKFNFTKECNSLRFAKWLINLGIWKHATIYDMKDKNKCIAYINKYI